MKHTPGPWSARPFASPVNTYYIADAHGDLIIGAGRSLLEADAKLIAAAPQLLDCLKRVNGHAPELPVLLVQDIMLAIAKAEGKP